MGNACYNCREENKTSHFKTYVDFAIAYAHKKLLIDDMLVLINNNLNIFELIVDESKLVHFIDNFPHNNL